jgi:signal peptidase
MNKFGDFLKKVYYIYYKIFLIFMGIILVGSTLVLLLNYLTEGKYSAYGVSSESMLPELKKYTLIINKKQENYSLTDIITFKAGTDNDIYTHRIVKKDGVRYKTKGDNNNVEDPWLVDEKNIIGKLEYKINYLGFFPSFLNSVAGIIILLIIPANTFLVLTINDIFTKKS